MSTDRNRDRRFVLRIAYPRSEAAAHESTTGDGEGTSPTAAPRAWGRRFGAGSSWRTPLFALAFESPMCVRDSVEGGTLRAHAVVRTCLKLLRASTPRYAALLR